jgi:hypothetical protein
VPIDVTINDPIDNARFSPSTTTEDNETEIGTVSNQTWDLERFTFEGASRTLNLIAGFDMRSGQGYYNNGNRTPYPYPMGDIFIRLGAPVFSGYNAGSDTMINAGWDYVIHFTSWPSGDGNVAYAVYANPATTVLTGTVPGSAHPGIYHAWQSGGTLIGSWAGTYNDGATVAELNAAGGAGLQGDENSLTTDEHDILSVGLEWLGSETFYLHATMECGNDVIHGRVPVPDGGMTLVLLGLSFVGMTLFPRKRN